MKILNVIPSVNPKDGGPVEYIRQIGMLMADHGHEMHVLSLDNPVDPWVKDFAIPIIGAGVTIRRFGVSFGGFRWLWGHVQEYDLVIVHGIWSFDLPMTWSMLLGKRVPLVIFVHGMLDKWFKESSPKKHLAKRIYWIAVLGRIMRGAAAAVFTVRDEVERARGQFFRETYRSRILAIGTGDAPPPTPVQVAAFRALMPMLGERQYLLFLSRIHPKKACDILIEAFAEHANAYPDIDLVIAGPDQVGWQKELKELARKNGIANRVHWPGMVSGDAKWGAFRGAEAFVLPSHQENFGIVVAESMACETPVIISRSIGIWREVEDTGCAMICDDNLYSCSEILGRFLALPKQERRQMGEKGRETFLRIFEVSKVSAETAHLLEDIVETYRAERGQVSPLVR